METPLNLERRVHRRKLFYPTLMLSAHQLGTVPLDLREELAKCYLDWRRTVIRERTSEYFGSETQDGSPTAVVLSTRTETLRWIGVVEEYFALRTPRCRPSPQLSELDQNTRFWVMHSPFQHLQTLDITVTGPIWGQDMTEGEVADLGRHLGWIPLQHLTLRVRDVNPLFNGIIQWPRLTNITTIGLHFTRGGPANEWKRPFFPHALRAFPGLHTLDLQVERLGDNQCGTANPHPLFASYSEGVPYITRKRGETSAATLRRVATNISYVCPYLEDIKWTQSSHEGIQWLTEVLAYKRNWVSLGWE